MAAPDTNGTPTSALPTTSSGVAWIAAASALWGTSGLFRTGLAADLPATTVVAAEHLLLVTLTLPLLVRGIRRARATFDRGDLISLVLVGAGSSALATVLFTAAFSYGSPSTPVLLQQLQPVFAVIGARIVLGERLTRRYPLFFVAAVVGAFLVAFRDPRAVEVAAAAPALLATGAAVLWGMGTVLGRRLTGKVAFGELAALRFGVGLVAALVLLPLMGGTAGFSSIGFDSLGALTGLVLLPGLAGLVLYYRGLRGTPASNATLAELTFPMSALVVGYVAFDDVLSVTQVVGVVILAATITAMSFAHRRGPQARGVITPAEAERV